MTGDGKKGFIGRGLGIDILRDSTEFSSSYGWTHSFLYKFFSTLDVLFADIPWLSFVYLEGLVQFKLLQCLSFLIMAKWVIANGIKRWITRFHRGDERKSIWSAWNKPRTATSSASSASSALVLSMSSPTTVEPEVDYRNSCGYLK